MNHTENELLKIIVDAAEDKLAVDTVVLKVDQLTPLSDYFVVTSGNNERKVEAIAHAIIEKVLEHGYEVKNVEGKDSNRWILIDCVDVIVHVFYEEERAHYNLEKLWADAPLVNTNLL
ncbi:ribosome silencing factor [Atopobacter phocae]|uniref:ribosome silencing factor n=1 Tax=Atopobacter phocae TaxID=136492 RepID=UPI00046F0229|nr:ribosome silencing factor [Atopobacter phocae]